MRFGGRIQRSSVSWRSAISAKNNAAEKKAPTSAAPARSYDVQIKNYFWDQSDKFVKVYLTGLKGVQDLPKEAVTQGRRDSIEYHE